MRFDRLLPWVLRILWVTLPATAGSAMASALDGRSASVVTVATVSAWAGWTVVLVGCLVAHPIALAVVRVGVPATIGVGVAAIAWGGSATYAALAVAHAIVLTVVAFLPETALHWVNGPAYPNERRFPLKPPGPLLLGPLPLAWLATVVSPAVGALLLASAQWVAGAVALAVGAGAVVAFGRSFLALTRRWLVFVPAGVVVHDPIRLVDPVLLRREDLVAIALAEHDTTAKDLTAGSLGMAVEISMRGPAPITVLGHRGHDPVTHSVTSLLVAPTRPGAVLAEVAARRLPASATP